MTTKTWLWVGVALGVGGAVQAQEKKAAPAKGADKAAAAAPQGPPRPAPELMSAAKFFIGSWKCEGTMPPGPWGPGGKTTATMSFKTDMGEMWVSAEGEGKMPDAKMPPMMWRGVNGWDPAQKKLIRIDWDSMGNVSHLTSAGWEGDKILFSGEGSMGGQRMKIRHTMTRKGDAEMTSAFEAAGADGKWMPMGTDGCKKAGGKPAK